MPPNCKEEKLPITECAAPFKDEQNRSGVSKPGIVQNGDPSSFVSLRREEISEMENNVRINTTHQYTYQLDKYRKNAMLIFHYDHAYQGSRETADKVRTIFEKFRFEVEVHHNLTGEEVKSISAVFFQRNFCEYGAVAIVVIGKTNRDGVFTSPGSKFNDKDILSNMMAANLKSKPKIIIFECDQIPRRFFTRKFADNDVIDFNFPSVVHTSSGPNRAHNLLSIFCDNLDTLADRHSLDSILLATVYEAKNRNYKWPPSYDENGALLRDVRPIFSRTYINLPKRLNLWRNP